MHSPHRPACAAPSFACLLLTAALWSPPLIAAEPEPVPGRASDWLAVEPVGIAPGRPWVDAEQIAPFKVPGTENWRVMIWHKVGGGERAVVFTSLDMQSGKLTELGRIPGIQPLPSAWLDGRLYIGMNVPAHLAVYDPASNTLRDLGNAFERGNTLYRMAAASDGTLALGAGGSSEVTLYTPSTGEFRRYGDIGGEGHGYVYYLDQDEHYIYAACRGGAPWQLVVIHKETGETRVALTVPPEGFMKVGDGTARVTEKLNDLPWKLYRLEDGQAIEQNDPPASANAAPEPKPEIAIDANTLYGELGKVTIHYKLPGDDAAWQQAHLEVPMEHGRVWWADGLDDGRIAAVGDGYYPAVIFDPATGKGKQFPLPGVSARSLLAVGGEVYVTGYPSTPLFRIKPEQAVTSTEAFSGREAVEVQSERANPRRIAYWPQNTDEGGHIGLGLVHGSDERIYFVARRHRHYTGFDIAWYDPATGAKGQFDDQGKFDHLQVGWFTITPDRQQLVLSTYVRPNDQIEGSAPDSARLFIVDIPTQAIVGEYTPLPGQQVLTAVAPVGDDHLVGIAPDVENYTSVLYRFNRRTGQVEQQRAYQSLFVGPTGTNGAPVKGGDFQLGPDGNIWTSAEVAAGQCVALRLNPADLSLQHFGKVEGNTFRYLFHGGEVYLTGGATLRRAPTPRIKNPAPWGRGVFLG